MKESWSRAIEFVLRMEGGYSNDPHDPGGETRYGISKRAYPSLDIARLTIQEAQEIYKRDYWDASGCDSLDYPLDVAVFDCAVNMGVGTAKKLQGISATPIDFLFNRIALYAKMKNFKFFGTGWVMRVILLYKTFFRKEV